jgi:DNA-directed RNA polymerase specialized sigma24 family protein
MKAPVTRTREMTPLEILAVRPRSDGDDMEQMLLAFARLNQSTQGILEIFQEIAGNSKKPKGIPTPEDYFADLLMKASTAADHRDRKLPLGHARSWLIRLFRETEIQKHRERGKRGGRGRRQGTVKPTMCQAVVDLAKAEFKKNPELRSKKPSFIVHVVAAKIGKYNKLDVLGKKRRRDYVRKILRANKLFQTKRSSTPLAKL